MPIAGDVNLGHPAGRSREENAAAKEKSMTQEALLRLNRKAEYRQAIHFYLEDLPVLDRQVLHFRHAEDRSVAEISARLSISSKHVERILNRAQEFVHTRKSVQHIPLRPFPVATQSPIAGC